MKLKVLTVGSLVAIAVVGCNPSGTKGSGTSNDTFQHAEDVTITSCVADAAGDLDAKVTVTNNSSKPSNYVVTIAFNSADGSKQLDTGDVVVNNLSAGQSTVQDALSVTTATPGYTCKVADAMRTAA